MNTLALPAIVATDALSEGQSDEQILANGLRSLRMDDQPENAPTSAVHEAEGAANADGGAAAPVDFPVVELNREQQQAVVTINRLYTINDRFKAAGEEMRLLNREMEELQGRAHSDGMLNTLENNVEIHRVAQRISEVI